MLMNDMTVLYVLGSISEHDTLITSSVTFKVTMVKTLGNVG